MEFATPLIRAALSTNSHGLTLYVFYCDVALLVSHHSRIHEGSRGIRSPLRLSDGTPKVLIVDPLPARIAPVLSPRGFGTVVPGQ